MPPSRVRLGAALFNGDHSRLAYEIERLVDAGIDFVHLDVFDGTLVADLGFSPRTISALRSLTSAPFEVHLAAREPERHLPALASAGADRVLFHVEGAPMAFETAYAVRELGMTPGVVLGLGAPIEWGEAALGFADAVLLLARVTGEGARGASFNPLVVPRAARLREAARAADVELQVAGGVNRDNAAEVVRAGADALALGAGIYAVIDMAAELTELRRIVASGSTE